MLERLLWSPTGAVRKADRAVPPPRPGPRWRSCSPGSCCGRSTPTRCSSPARCPGGCAGGGSPREPVPSEPPAVTGRAQDATPIDRAAAGAAFGLLHDLELVVQRMEEEPHRLLRTGGLGTRDVAGAGPAAGRRSGAHDLPGGVRGRRRAAGRRTGAAPAADQRVRPLARPAAPHPLAAGRRGLVARRPACSARSPRPGAHALGPEAEFPASPACGPPCSSWPPRPEPGPSSTSTQLAAAVAWQRPRLLARTARAAALMTLTWREAAWLGLVRWTRCPPSPRCRPAGRSRAGGAGRAVPGAGGTIIIQADLTAVAAGPLAYAVAQDLRRLADQESRGAAGVFRFSAASLRRAYDRGLVGGRGARLAGPALGHPGPASRCTTWSTTSARRHGSIRIGPAAGLRPGRGRGSGRRPADPARARRRSACGQVAPTVLVAAVEEEELLALLREAGHAPVVEDAAGRAAPPAGPGTRTAARPPAPASEPPPRRAGRHCWPPNAPIRHARTPGRLATPRGVDRLRSATQQARPVRVGYVTADGRPTERELAPLDLGAGAVRAVGPGQRPGGHNSAGPHLSRYPDVTSAPSL